MVLAFINCVILLDFFLEPHDNPQPLQPLLQELDFLQDYHEKDLCLKEGICSSSDLYVPKPTLGSYEELRKEEEDNDSNLYD